MWAQFVDVGTKVDEQCQFLSLVWLSQNLVTWVKEILPLEDLMQTLQESYVFN